MNKELLNKILPYCGYELKATYEKYVCDVCVSSSRTNKIPAERLVEKSRGGTYHWKPILFPLDCLTREIETEHGKEVPIIEMAKLSAGDYDWKVDGGYGCDYDLNGVSKLLFEFHHHSCNFSFALKDAFEMEQLPVDHQFELFQYLYSRHIAFNLEPDEYVSVESLEKNPYVDSKTNNQP